MEGVREVRREGEGEGGEEALEAALKRENINQDTLWMTIHVVYTTPHLSNTCRYTSSPSEMRTPL